MARVRKAGDSYDDSCRCDWYRDDWRRAHLLGYREAGAQIVAVADLVGDRAAKAAEDFGAASWYEDYRELLSDSTIDAVSVCTPNHLHKEVTITALRAGKHVLCEKPMAMNTDEHRVAYSDKWGGAAWSMSSIDYCAISIAQQPAVLSSVRKLPTPRTPAQSR
ncbi:MAG: Gfo/Idh/MocA family protein [Bacilli bacterium]